VFGKASSTAAFMSPQMVVDSPKRKRDGARRAAEGVCEASKPIELRDAGEIERTVSALARALDHLWARRTIAPFAHVCFWDSASIACAAEMRTLLEVKRTSGRVTVHDSC